MEEHNDLPELQNSYERIGIQLQYQGNPLQMPKMWLQDLGEG